MSMQRPRFWSDAEHLPDPLTPQTIMGRNEPCWCRSGKKWKHCHRERAREERRNVHELLEAVRREQTKGYCVHPDAGTGTCSGKSTNAHTIQKEGGLRAISENGHIVSIKKGAFAIGKNGGKIVPVQEGIANASTFPGFCNAHDVMFGPTNGRP
jgi:SEC-C motif